MAKPKIKRENIITAVSVLLTIAVIALSAYLIGILGKDINRFMSAGENLPAETMINFNFDAYDALGL